MTTITLSQYLNQGVAQGHFDHALSVLLHEVADESQRISENVHRGALAGVLGSAGSENVQGETQKKLDIIANDMMLEALEKTAVVAAAASEELDHCSVYAGGDDRPYLILFDPLDGSSNIDVNVSIGTIFSVLKNPRTGPVTDESFLQPGTAQIAAGYVVYGPQTQLVLTTGHGVDAFTLDRSIGLYIQTSSRVQIPVDTKEFAINMSNQRHWYPPVQRYISELLAGKTGPREKDFNMRWIASMVADVHRVLCRGGTFMYPKDLREPGKPGKLRLMYEANPMSMIVEQAGGKSYAGTQRILEIQPTSLHQRCSVMLGSAREIDIVHGYHLDNPHD